MGQLPSGCCNIPTPWRFWRGGGSSGWVKQRNEEEGRKIRLNFHRCTNVVPGSCTFADPFFDLSEGRLLAGKRGLPSKGESGGAWGWEIWGSG